MANLQTRNTKMAIVEEVIEGVAVEPSAGTDFIPLLEDFTLEPSFDELENTEIQASIGQSKNTLGLENPTASVGLYVKPSGTEGTAPNWGPLIKSLLGSEVVKSEFDTVGGSTVSTVVVDAGEGVNYSVGQALLVKNATSGANYAVRNVASISGDTLTLAQDLAVAPPSGINLGQAIMYIPTNDSHPTLSLWNYRGGDGAIELVTGARAVSWTIDVPAADFISGTFAIEGLEYKFDPITIVASSNDTMDFTDGSGAQVATVAAGTYKDPYELASALQTAMDAESSDTITVTYDDETQKFTLASTGGTFSLDFATGPNTADTIAPAIAFSVADQASPGPHTSDLAVDLAPQFTPAFDDQQPLVAKDNQVKIGDAQDITCFGAQSLTYNITNTKADVLDMCSSSGKSGTLFTERAVSVDVVAYLSKGQAEEFKRFRANDEIVFTHTAGEKSGGNWLPGKVFNGHMPSARIASFSLEDSDGIVTLNMTIQGFVKDGNPEVYINFL